jgi:hypothetical protein
VLLFVSFSPAQQLISFTVSPTTIAGDGHEEALGSVTVYVSDPNETSFPVMLSASGSGGLGVLCGAGQIYPGGCDYSVSQGTNLLLFHVTGTNSSSSADVANLTVSWGTQITQNITLLPVQNPQQPPPS